MNTLKAVSGDRADKAALGGWIIVDERFPSVAGMILVCSCSVSIF